MIKLLDTVTKQAVPPKNMKVAKLDCKVTIVI